MVSSKRGSLPGPRALFRGKVRAPVSITLTPEHHRRVNEAMQRLNLTRAEVIALLIELGADALMPYDVDRFKEDASDWDDADYV